SAFANRPRSIQITTATRSAKRCSLTSSARSKCSKNDGENSFVRGALMDRRAFLAGSGLYFAGSMFARAATGSPFADIEAVLGGRVGVMAIDTGDGSVMSHREDERFAMCSTF